MSKEVQKLKSRRQSYEKILESDKKNVRFLSIISSFRIIKVCFLLIIYQNDTKLSNNIQATPYPLSHAVEFEEVEEIVAVYGCK